MIPLQFVTNATDLANKSHIVACRRVHWMLGRKMLFRHLGAPFCTGPSIFEVPLCKILPHVCLQLPQLSNTVEGGGCMARTSVRCRAARRHGPNLILHTIAICCSACTTGGPDGWPSMGFKGVDWPLSDVSADRQRENWINSPYPLLTWGFLSSPKARVTLRMNSGFRTHRPPSSQASTHSLGFHPSPLAVALSHKWRANAVPSAGRSATTSCSNALQWNDSAPLLSSCPEMNGWRKSSCVDGRDRGSRCRQRRSTSRRSASSTSGMRTCTGRKTMHENEWSVSIS